MARRAGSRRSIALLMVLFGALLLSSTADAAGAAKRKRRKRADSSSTDSGGNSNTNSGNTNSGSSGGKTTAPAKAKGGGGGGEGGSLDDQIKVRSRIRVYRRATSDAVNGANLNGTMIFVPGGNAAGVSVDYTSQHAGKTVRGKVKVTGSGDKAAATITASRAQ
jgi:hypothetical protein